MKNLLYTFILGLVVISCNKDEEYASAPLALSQDIEATVDVDIDGLLGRLIETTSNNKSKPSSLTSKDGNNYITLYVGNIGDDIFEFVFSSNFETCNNDTSASSLQKIYLVKVSESVHEVRLTLDGSAIQTISRSLPPIYDLDIFQGLALHLDGTHTLKRDQTGTFLFTF